ncbi:unnamed protein product [Didymodactylos carnosus]|uniref:Uncharacterized protein n=1 Tax=Didymodactylos carnosus TaxID=1234261 RepID=A0A814YHP3_9BILA|nr:unnamed protein product [Didymodactylos carnosus]CAF1229334.1 unnamed protein product [Didymodactylos carnosus]CAF3972175.1 unnamed protein product [Didymodactylos carnosus]CAF3992067.1 unnamed protein product [Didymodactylos carnosus]
MPSRKRRVRSTSYRKLSYFDSAREGAKSKSKFKPKLVKSRKQKASPSSSPSSDSSFSVDDTESSDKSAASKPEKKEKNRKKKTHNRKQLSSSDDSDDNPNFGGKEITSESRQKRKFSSSLSRLTVTEQAATLQVTVNDSISRFSVILTVKNSN